MRLDVLDERDVLVVVGVIVAGTAASVGAIMVIVLAGVGVVVVETSV